MKIFKVYLKNISIDNIYLKVCRTEVLQLHGQAGQTVVGVTQAKVLISLTLLKTIEGFWSRH